MSISSNLGLCLRISFLKHICFISLLFALICSCSDHDISIGAGVVADPSVSLSDSRSSFQFVVENLPEYIAPRSVSISVEELFYVTTELDYSETVNSFIFLSDLTSELQSIFENTNSDYPVSIHAHILCRDCSEYDSDTVITKFPATLPDGFPSLTLSNWQRQEYSSSDFSAHGNIHTLNQHSDGQGIRLMFLGDGFSDRQIASGYYEEVMQRAVDHFFSVPPFDQFKSLFDVWYMDAISEVEGCRRDATKDNPNRSAFRSWYGSGTKIGSDQDAVMQFVEPVLGKGYDGLFNSHIVVVLNSTKHAGSTYLYWPNNFKSDFGEGWAFCYLPLAQDNEHLARLIHHEANGHGFAKLGDEYFHDKNGDCPASAMKDYLTQSSLGWLKNIDIIDYPDSIKWAYMLHDPEFVGLGTGIFEGGLTYSHGFYRPSDNSIMRNNQGIFNAPSAEAIWYRIHKLAYGDTWQYDAEAFRSWFLTEHGKNNALSIPVITRTMTTGDDDASLHAPISGPCPWNASAETDIL